ncbi:MAG: hypothetical protein FWE82_03485, partial [Defluviitaleaceae bacterium]|nr:hypothetical protein [Defluviitaleaceae bacterium]
MPHLFNEKIASRSDWVKINTSVKSFDKLIKFIFNRHGIEAEKIKSAGWCSNAVFKSKNYAIKIFAPKEAGIPGVGTVMAAELYGLLRAKDLSVPAPVVVASGNITDRYEF